MAKDFTIDKPLELFNAYVSDISASASYGSDGSTCQITLIGPEDADGKSLDGFNKDYKPDFPELGTSIGIVWEGFSFGGVLQRYTKKRGISGYTWDVIIEAPAKVLDGVKVITENFQGTAFTGGYDPEEPQNPYYDMTLAPWSQWVFNKQMNNIWNPFALRENYTYGGIFGASDVNAVGWLAIDLLKMIQQISTGAGEQGTGLWASEGRGKETGDINFDGIPDEHDFGSPSTNAFGGKAVFGESEYLLDLNAVIDIPDYPEFFRIKGPVQSITSILQEAVDIAVHDYIVGVHPCHMDNAKVATEFRADWEGWYDRLLKNTRIIYSTPDGPQYSSIKGATRIGFPIEYATMKWHKDDGTVVEVDTSIKGEPDVVELITAGGLDYESMIKISVQDKTSQPTEGVVEDMVKQAETSDTLVSADSGKEFNDAVTQKLVIGGPASRYWKAKQQNLDLMPIWGRSQVGYSKFYLGHPYDVTKDAWSSPSRARQTAMTPVTLVLNDGTLYEATILEIRAAITGNDNTTWRQYHQIIEAFQRATRHPRDLDQHFARMAIGLDPEFLNQPGRGPRNLPLLQQNMLGPNGLIDTRGIRGNRLLLLANTLIQNRLDMIFEVVQQAGRTMWGQQFLARLPVEPGGQPNNLKWVREDQEYISSWNIASSAWADEGDGLRGRLPSDPRFYDADGKLRTVAVWELDVGNTTYQDYMQSTVFGGPPIQTAAGSSNLRIQTDPPRTDYTDLRTDYAMCYGGIGSTQAQVDQEILWIPDVVRDSEGELQDVVTACVPVTCPAVRYHDDYTRDTAGSWPTMIFLITGLNVRKFSAFTQFGNCAILGGKLAPINIAPEMFGIPQQSTRYNWGPWMQYSKLDGKAEVSFETNLRPETFGSLEKLNEAGAAYSFVGNAMLGGQESGYIEVAEVPNYNLTDRFAGSGPYITNIDINIATDGITTTYKFNTWTRNFGKLAKYNVDRIARINKNTIKFIQEQRNQFQDRAIPPFRGNFGMQIMQGEADRENERRNQALIAAGIIPARRDKPSLLVNVQGLDIEDALRPLAQNYTGSYVCSNEQIYSPIEIKGRFGHEDSAPGFRPSAQVGAQPDDPDGNVVGVQDSKGNFGSQHVGPTNSELNAYFSFGNPKENTDFEIVAFNQTADNVNLYLSEMVPTEVRTMGLKGPIILSGWGFGLDDTPVPAKGRTGDEKFQFAEGASRFRTMWKTGPVDLKWDDERQVWSGGPQFVEGKLTSELTKGKLDAPTTATMDIYRRGWDNTLKETITLRNRDNSLEQEVEVQDPNDNTRMLDLNVYVIAMRINYEWRPIWVGCPDEDKATEKSDTTDDSSSSSSSSSDGGSNAGYGEDDMYGW